MYSFRSLYRRLPIVRELREASAQIKALRNCCNDILLQALVSQEQELLALPRFDEAGRLHRHQSQLFSQNGEDGVIREIFRRIGTKTQTFVEIGSGSGIENNTTFLLMQDWKGCWIEGDQAEGQVARQRFGSLLETGQLRIAVQTVTAENIETVLRDLGVPDEFDLLSIDIDRNTYWVWRAIRQFRPRVVVTEYNAAIPKDVDWRVEYHPTRGWNGSSYFGAGLKSFEVLGTELGYSLVGCDLHGVNAFFVRRELCAGKFAEPFTAENHYEPARYHLVRRVGYPPSFSDLG